MTRSTENRLQRLTNFANRFHHKSPVDFPFHSGPASLAARTHSVIPEHTDCDIKNDIFKKNHPPVFPTSTPLSREHNGNWSTAQTKRPLVSKRVACCGSCREGWILYRISSHPVKEKVPRFISVVSVVLIPECLIATRSSPCCARGRCRHLSLMIPGRR